MRTKIEYKANKRKICHATHIPYRRHGPTADAVPACGTSDRRRLAPPFAQARTAGSRSAGPPACRHSPDRGNRTGVVRRGHGRPAARHRRDRRPSSRRRAARGHAARDRRYRRRHGRNGERVLGPSRLAFRQRPGAVVRRRAHSRCRRVASAGIEALRSRARATGLRPDRKRCRDAVGDGRRAPLRHARRGGRHTRRGLPDRKPEAPARCPGKRGNRVDAAPLRRRDRPQCRDDPLADRRSAIRRRGCRFPAARLADRDVPLPRRAARHLGCGMVR